MSTSGIVCASQVGPVWPPARRHHWCRIDDVSLGQTPSLTHVLALRVLYTAGPSSRLQVNADSAAVASMLTHTGCQLWCYF